jgi:low affinity Fe/Cu permease
MGNNKRSFTSYFRVIANKISTWAGSAGVFLGAILIVLVWASTGPTFNYSDTWQLIINTGTTIVTFLMVFLIQNTQNRDTKAIQLKLDELIHANTKARDTFVGLEDLTDEELVELDKEFKKLAEDPVKARALAKLHRKIEAEKQQRFSIRNQAGQVISTLLKPLSHGYGEHKSKQPEK